MFLVDFFKNLFGIYNIREVILMKMLGKIDIFKGYSKGQLYRLIKKFYLNDYKEGVIIVKQNTKPSVIGIVEEGCLDVLIIQDNGEKNKLGEITHGGLYAEMSFFNNTNAMATIVAQKDTIVWEITTADFANFLKNDPRLFDQIRETIKKRTQVNKLKAG